MSGLWDWLRRKTFELFLSLCFSLARDLGSVGEGGEVVWRSVGSGERVFVKGARILALARILTSRQ